MGEVILSWREKKVVVADLMTISSLRNFTACSGFKM
jgi:hypothetical protein